MQRIVRVLPDSMLPLARKGGIDMAGRLADKVAIVVGAGSSGPGWGNGKCTAVTFAREGAKVLCVDHNLASAEETVALIKQAQGTAVAFKADVTKDAEIKAMVADAMKRWGKIDIRYNPYRPLPDGINLAIDLTPQPETYVEGKLVLGSY